MKDVLVFSGGRGSSTLIKALVKEPNLRLNILVNAYDNGLSTGVIREVFGILGISDIRKTIGTVLKNDVFSEILEERVKITHKKELFSFFDFGVKKILDATPEGNRRYIEKLAADARKLLESFELPEDEYAFGNILMVPLFKSSNINSAISTFLKALGSKHRVYVNSQENLYLVAVTQSGHVLLDEAEIVGGRSSVSIEKIYLLQKDHLEIAEKLSAENDLFELVEFLKVNNVYPVMADAVCDAVVASDYIFYAPGTPHSSLYPTYVTTGLAEAIIKSNAKKVFVSNIGADYETPSYRLSDYIISTVSYLNADTSQYLAEDLIDVVLASKGSLVDRTKVVLDTKHKVFNGLEVSVDSFESVEHSGRHSVEAFTNFFNRAQFEW
ncbi:2-phospho-L-lactate transferase CofD family protein [Neptuniibacter sp. QD48_55]|uniref:2-phospho-L-lactate transferase CofD family protein n=1 Tax=Neptuniibacter sp. QD48_55 TaxID=3398212 RepID=UPI0039F55C7C